MDPPKPKGKKKGKKKAKPSQWAGEAKLQRSAVGVEVFVPVGATERSLTLTVVMRDFDVETDSHAFADQALAGRPASQVIEIVADPPIIVFDLPMIVRVTHQIADLDKSNLAAVIAKPLPPSEDSQENVATQDSWGNEVQALPVENKLPQYAEYSTIADSRFDRLTATLRVNSVGKLMVVDSSPSAVHMVYAMLEIPRAGRHTFSKVLRERERERERERPLLGTMSITGWSRARPAVHIACVQDMQ